MDDPPILLPVSASNAATRRIAQLESALARRHEQIDDLQTALAAVQESHAYRLATLISKLANKLLPLHSRRRRAVRAGLGAVLRGVRRVTGRDWANIQKGGEGTTVALDAGQYARWIAKHEVKTTATTFARRPTISIVVPLYNTPLAYLDAMVKSVERQRYPHWQLCLVDGGSQATHVSEYLSKLNDPRIVIEQLNENRGIAGNTNAAIALATGDYIAFLDHDDELAAHALAAVVETINRRPGADFIYSDEDKLDEHGQRCDPCFKPDWSPDLLRTHNYICHFLVLKRSLVESLGGIRTGFDGAQDYDLVLRASEYARDIVHIPQVLYHWRLHQQSTAANTASKEYLVEAGRKALVEHLQRCESPARVTAAAKPGMYHVHYRLATQPLVSILIPNRDSPELLERCLRSIEHSTYAHHEILILENGTTNADTLALYERSHVRVIPWHRPFNYAAINNVGASNAQGDLLLFLNNDVESDRPEWLERMVEHAVRPEIGAVGAKLLYADGTIQHAGVVLGLGGAAGHSHLRFPGSAAGYADRLQLVQNVSAVTGACLMTRRDVFQKVGGFDERFVLAYNDVDYGLAVRAAGYRVLWTPDAELFHLESKTRGYEDDPAKAERFRREFDLFRHKWAEALAAGDPYYHPAFRLDRADFALRA